MKNLTAFIGIFTAVLALEPCQAQASTVFNQNLIINGDAESGSGGNGFTLLPIPGFTTTGNFTVTQYGASGGFASITDPGPVYRGLNFFSGGDSNTSSSATQQIDISNASTLVDSGDITFELSAYLGGFSNHRDNAILNVSFLDVSNGSLGNASIGPITNSDRNNLTALMLSSTTGFIPTGTRFIDVSLTMTRLDGSYNDGYADNLSLAIRPVPVPPAALLMISGLGTLFVGFRRRLRQSAA